VTGHWLIGHFSHRRGGQSWIIDGVAAQGYNVGLAGLISMGESWHNNHHAFPGSAKMGLFPGQIDLGWWLIRTFETIGLATNVKTPDNLPPRPGLRRLAGANNTEALVASGHSRARS
jgi:stearoyl-CoA desaturase (delta-9 desaturase)